LKQILNIAHYETLHIIKDPILFLVVFIASISYVSLFGMVYVSSVLTDIPMAIVDQDHSELSREISSAFRNSSHFEVVESINTYGELEKGMKEGTVRAGIVIPENFFDKISQHRHTEVLTVYDGSNLIWGYNIRKYVLEVISHFNKSHTASNLGKLGLSKYEINNIMNTVDCNIITWYNPTFSYTNFLFMGLVMMIIHQLGLLSAGLTVTREKERNSWIQYIATSIPMWKIALGKCLPYLIASFFNYSMLLWISSQFIHVKIEGGFSSIILLGLLFNIIIIFTGFCISIKGPNSLQVTRYLMLLSVPVFFISGYTWPATHMPEVLNGLARLLPFTWMAEGFRRATIKNIPIQELSLTLVVLGIMAVLAVGFAMSFKKQRNVPGKAAFAVNEADYYPHKK